MPERTVALALVNFPNTSFAFSPAFSARILGNTSNALPNLLNAY